MFAKFDTTREKVEAQGLFLGLEYTGHEDRCVVHVFEDEGRRDSWVERIAKAEEAKKKGRPKKAERIQRQGHREAVPRASADLVAKAWEKSVLKPVFHRFV